MSGWVMWTIAVVVVLLPVVLMFAFNGTDLADARGRRISRRWRGRLET
jgi:hypothetical protein